MQDIKYRCWSSFSQHMNSWEDLREHGDFYRLLDQVAQYPLMQYTGLQDKHGVDIYEGDFVKQTLGRHYWVYEIKTLGGQFGNCLFAVTIKDNSSYEEDTWTYTERATPDPTRSCVRAGKDCEVIGNIYENPEIREVINE